METTLRAVRLPGRVLRRPHPIGAPGGGLLSLAQRQEAVGWEELRGLAPHFSAEPAKYALEVNKGLLGNYLLDAGSYEAYAKGMIALHLSPCKKLHDPLSVAENVLLKSFKLRILLP